MYQSDLWRIQQGTSFVYNIDYSLCFAIIDYYTIQLGTLMPVRDLVFLGDRRLRANTVAVDVQSIDDSLREVVQDMYDTMYACEGVGLAATQIGLDIRVATIDVSESRDQPMCLINPELKEASDFYSILEGCLSVPGVSATVERAQKRRRTERTNHRHHNEHTHQEQRH